MNNEPKEPTVQSLAQEVDTLQECVMNLGNALHRVVLLLAEQHPESRYYLLPLARKLTTYKLLEKEFNENVTGEVCNDLPVFVQDA